MASAPQWLTDLKTRRDAITAELAAIDNTGSRAKPGSKPDQGGEGGGTEHTAYRMSLLEELAQINEIIGDAADVIKAEEAAQYPDEFTIEVQMDS